MRLIAIDPEYGVRPGYFIAFLRMGAPVRGAGGLLSGMAADPCSVGWGRWWSGWRRIERRCSWLIQVRLRAGSGPALRGRRVTGTKGPIEPADEPLFVLVKNRDLGLRTVVWLDRCDAWPGLEEGGWPFEFVLF